jgi:hypothetical protein
MWTKGNKRKHNGSTFFFPQRKRGFEKGDIAKMKKGRVCFAGPKPHPMACKWANNLEQADAYFA